MNVFELFGTIAIDNSEAERGLDKTVRHARNTENALEQTFKRIGRYVATAFSVTAIVNFGKTCTQVYASVAAEESAFAQVMGDYADTARDKLNAVANQTGIASTRMTGAMTSMTAKFMGLGYSVDDATTLATDGLMIAADAAAFWDMSFEDSMAHLNSFINGSYEAGEAIGLFANDSQMAAYAVQQGFVADAAAWAQLDEATKQAIRLNFARMMQEASGVTGQAANEAGAYANVLANLQEAWRQLQAVIGKPILEKFVLPAMQKLVELMPGLTETVQKGVDWLTEGFDKIAAYFSEVFTEDGIDMNAFPNALRNMFRDVARSIPSLLSSVGRSIRTAWVNTVWPAVQGAFKMAFGVELPEWSEIESAVVAWWDGGNGIATKIAEICNWTLNMFGAPATVTEEDVKTILSDWWAGAKGLVSSFCDWTLKLFSNPVEAAADVGKTVKGWWAGVKSGAESALDWVLKLFGVPEAKANGVKNLVSGWWQGVKTAAQEVLIWTLKLFENPKETAGQVATNISTWWAGVVASAQSALEWWLQLFENPKETADKVGEVVGDWWDGVKSAAQDALIWTLKLFGVPNADGNGVKNLVSGWWQGVKTAAQNALNWTLNMFDLPEGDPVAIITDWWNGIRPSIESALDIDLSNIDIAGIFTAASTAVDNFIENVKTFYTDVVNAIAVDEAGRIKLVETLSGLFDAGATSIANLLGSASTLVADIVASITSKDADAEEIGEVFADLFSWASEIVIGVKDDAIAVFQWFKDNGKIVAPIIASVAIAMASFALANPAIAVVASLVALIGTMTTDWENFETNHPQLVEMFEKLTGLDFTNVATTLDAFKSNLEGLLEYFTANESRFTTLLSLAGALAFIAGHPVAGTALLTAAGYIEKENRGEIGRELADQMLRENMAMAVIQTNTDADEKEALLRFFRNLPNPWADDPNGGGKRFPEENPPVANADDVAGYEAAVATGRSELMLQAMATITSGMLPIPSKTKIDDNGGGSFPLGAPALVENIIFDTENLDPATTGMTSLVTMMQNMFAQNNTAMQASVQEGIAAGLSGVAVKVDVSTGDVVLSEGTLVGRIAPRVNAALGTYNQRSSRKRV